MTMRPLDICKMPLDKKVLIEASAGTGKTYTIGLIVLRLLLESNISIEKIVLITFTRGAAAELRKKTTEKLLKAYEIWKNGSEENNDLTAIIKIAKKDNPQLKEAILLDSITHIDEMPVYTIHGFCEKLLNQFSFETGNFEEKEIITDQSDIIDGVIADFWRKEIKKLSIDKIPFLPDNFSPEVLKIGIEKIINFPNAEIKFSNKIPNIDYKKLITEKNEMEEKFEGMKLRLEEYAKSSGIEIPYNKDCKKINEREAKKNSIFMEYNEVLKEFCLILKEYEQAGNELVTELQYKLAKILYKSMKKEKNKIRVMGFDDLIENTFNSVKNDREKILFKAVQKRYDAILVDEFQDTDGNQYEIFNALFYGKPFFMIGDPKQAIYRFRGGDIYTYLYARKNTDGQYRYTLEKNYRSQSRLLQGLNKIFTKTDNPFVNEDIGYIPVKPGGDIYELTINNEAQKPVIIRNRSYKNKNDEQDEIREEIIYEIINLLYKTDTQIYDKRTDDKRKLKAQDIAILTRTNALAKEYRNALRENKTRIPAVILRSDNVLLSEDADYMIRLLTAFINSQKESYIRAALMEARDLMITDIKPFADSYETWKKYGVMKAINEFLDSNRLWSKILISENGERHVTNLRQLIGILNKEEEVTGRIPEKILRKFSELIRTSNDEENEEKLETDDDAVQIMTIHASKGMEFPVVFIPDIVMPGEISRQIYEKEPPIYHKGNNIIIEYDLLSRSSNGVNAKEIEKTEILEETARNFYVAVTRPIYRLYIANSYKENQKDKSAGQNICSSIEEDENILITDSFSAIEYPQNNAKINDNRIITTEEIQGSKFNNPRTFDIKISPAWQKTSFTGIARHLVPGETAFPTQTNELIIPGGRRTGTLLHSIFENLDFDADVDEIHEIVEHKLGGFSEFSDASEKGKMRKLWIENQIKIILHKELPGGAGKLCYIGSASKAPELNFFFKSDGINLNKINEAIKDKITGFEKADLNAQYVKGIIDLIFLGKDRKYYILDWKSNILGDYSKKEVENTMLLHGYHLQYCIYTAALKRWLEITQTDFDFKRQFGGIFYIFIRGISEEKDNYDGIYFIEGCNIYDSVDKIEKSFGR